MLVGKAELERRYAVAFLESIGQPAKVSPLPAGSGPDFAASLDIGVVGVEVTRLYRDDEEHGVPHREAEGRWDQVLTGAHREWRRAGLPTVTVYVRSLPGVTPEKSAVPDLVRELVTFVADRLPAPDGSASFERDWTSWSRSSSLPDGVAAIDVLRPSYHDETYWFMPRAGMVPDLSAALLQRRISAKNARFTKYTAPPAENWLLLIAEGTAPSSIFTFLPDTIERTYESVFSKTYLFEAFSRRAFELRTSRPSEPAA